MSKIRPSSFSLHSITTIGTVNILSKGTAQAQEKILAQAVLVLKYLVNCYIPRKSFMVDSRIKVMVMDFFFCSLKDLHQKCTKEMDDYVGCMYYHTNEFDLCRKEQQAFEKHVGIFAIDNVRPLNFSREMHATSTIPNSSNIITDQNYFLLEHGCNLVSVLKMHISDAFVIPGN
ncbi:hypothetical protein V8G54_009682 [Vigna mungo]|uniref:CHCH domain-containing protein n=1 Tax=Vigna mungo TaxID=3915 RepID=A0AAQ3NVN1_VIGMU